MIVDAIAADPHGVGRADDFRQADQVSQIGLVPRGQGLRPRLSLGMAEGTGDYRHSGAEDKKRSETRMYDLLVHEKTFARLEAELKARMPEVQPVIIGEDGRFWAMDGTELAEMPQPDLVYGNVDAFFGKAVLRFMEAVLSTPRLQFFQSSAAGIEHPILMAAREKAELYAGCHEQALAIAEWVLWAGFDWLQDGAGRRAAQAEANWVRLPFREITDTRWLIFGFGAIGRATAQRLRALGAHVTGVRRTPGADADADAMVQPGDMGDALGQADVVLLCCPLTDETASMADAAFFTGMKPGALFLNVGRGGLVDEPALLASLDAGTPGHAMLDVVSVEPLPEDNPIWAHPKVTLTAHISAHTEGAARRTDQVFLGNLDRFLAGKELVNLVE